MNEPRLSIAPLEALALASLGRRGFCPVGAGGPQTRNMNYAAVSEVAELAGTSRRQWYRWRRTGVDVWQADELAVRFGRHPGELWPEWWETALWEEAA